jgi:hypothetical protein
LAKERNQQQQPWEGAAVEAKRASDWNCAERLRGANLLRSNLLSGGSAIKKENAVYIDERLTGGRKCIIIIYFFLAIAIVPQNYYPEASAELSAEGSGAEGLVRVRINCGDAVREPKALRMPCADAVCGLIVRINCADAVVRMRLCG